MSYNHKRIKLIVNKQNFVENYTVTTVGLYAKNCIISKRINVGLFPKNSTVTDRFECLNDWRSLTLIIMYPKMYISIISNVFACHAKLLYKLSNYGRADSALLIVG